MPINQSITLKFCMAGANFKGRKEKKKNKLLSVINHVTTDHICVFKSKRTLLCFQLHNRNEILIVMSATHVA